MEKDTGSGFEMFILQTEKNLQCPAQQISFTDRGYKNVFFFLKGRIIFFSQNTKVAEEVLLKIEAGQNPFLLKCKEKKQVRYKC